jgi:hypothetical protein
VEQGEKLTGFDRNFDIDLGRAAFGENLMLTWGKGEPLKCGILILI